MHITTAPRVKESKIEAEKKIFKEITKNLSKFNTHWFTDFIRSANSKQDKCKEKHAQAHHH